MTIIEVQGGCIMGVYCSDKQQLAYIVDYDNEEVGENPLGLITTEPIKKFQEEADPRIVKMIKKVERNNQ